MTKANTERMAKLPNLFLRESDANHGRTLGGLAWNSLMAEAIYTVAVAKPHWRFKVSSQGGTRVEEIAIIDRGETLGTVDLAYSRRYGNTVLQIKNHRIETKKGTTKTGDVKRAVTTIKRLFSAKTRTERLTDASAEAAQVLNRAYSNCQSAVGRDDYAIKEQAQEWALHKATEEFHAYLRKYKPSEFERIARLEEAREKYATVDHIKERYEKGKAALAVLDDDKYVVRHGTNVFIYDDHTLPDHLRGRLGLLKLVEEGALVSSCGCRVNAEAFVVLINADDPPLVQPMDVEGEDESEDE